MPKSSQQTISFITRRQMVSAVFATVLLATLMAPRALGQGGSNNGCPVGAMTTITGHVYSPNGTDPLPNILVYVPTTAVQPLPTGITTCLGASMLVSGNPLVTTTTAADGSFTLTNPGLSGTQTLVIQAGKWRRQYPGIQVTGCQTNIAPKLAMPQDHTQGDIPQIAISTGASDAIECVFRKIGISDSEFSAPGGGGHISLYAGSQAPGITFDASGTKLPLEQNLVGNSATLNAEDLAVFACQGSPMNYAAGILADQQNLDAFADAGGRVFATHFSYVWLEENPEFSQTANWTADVSIGNPNQSINATIDQSYPEGVVLADWLYGIGATPIKGQLPLFDTRKDQSGINSPAQSWATLNDSADGNPVMQFTFDTPINSATTPSITVAFANSPGTYNPQAGQNTGSVAIGVTNSSTATADSSLNLSVVLPQGVTATSLAPGPGSGWICSVATLTCNRTTALNAGTTDGLTLGLSVATTAPVGNALITITVAGGGLSDTNQCGRVLYNEYHVEPVGNTNATMFPAECNTTAMTAQEKFLEFSLYNLSNFVAPLTRDTIDIVQTPTTAWGPIAPIYYGTLLTTVQLDATASVPGTFAYTPPVSTVLPVGMSTMNAVFTPSDPLSYGTASASNTITVLQDTTTTAVTATPNPSLQGSLVTLTATVVGNAAAPTGTVTFYNGTTPIGTGTLTASTGDASVATLTTSTLPLGSNSITAAYGVTTNFGASMSMPLAVSVQGVSTTTITGLVSPIDYGQIIGDTAQIVVAGSSSGGTTTVYINGVNVCVLPVSPGMTTTCPATTGAGYDVGSYSIYAVFSGDTLYAGSTSPTYTVQIVPDPTTTTLASSLNPSRMGNSVTFTATVSALYAFPTGPVNFYDGGTLLGPGTLGPATNNLFGVSVATYSTTALTVGNHNITASYAATKDFNTSATVNPLVQVVLPPLPLGGAPGYILTVTPTTVNAPVGAATPITVSIQEVNGYSEPIALTCAGLTNEATCTYQPSTVPAGGGTTTLYLTPAAPHACGSDVPLFVASNRARWIAEGGLGMASVLLLLGLTTRRRRKLLQAALLVLALCAMPMLNGCGTVGCTDLGTKPGTYSFTVTAAPTEGPSGQYEGAQSQTVTYNATL